MPIELPDNIRDWPNDPFALLGVERGADDLTIRRAYTQLIRRFKPEHHPDEFSKIRAAYEACQQQASWFRHDGDDEPDDPEVVQVPLPKWAVSESGIAESSFNKAICGNLAEAYNDFVTDANASLQLYWLLMIDPSLDPKRTRHDWLWRALSHALLQDSALELYKRELQTDPKAALDEPYTEIFTISIEVPKLIELARFRIAAAARMGRYSLIEFNLKQLKNRLGVDNDHAWLSLIVCVLDIEWPVNNQPNFLRTFCSTELHLLEHLELHSSYLFDLVEDIEYWRSQALNITGPIMAKFIRMIGMIRADSDLVSRAEIIETLIPIAEQPHIYLECFDRFKEVSESLLLLATQTFRRYYRNNEDSFRPDILRGFMRKIVETYGSNWNAVRVKLLETTTRYGIHPNELACACEDDVDKRYRNFSELLKSDSSLYIVWLASCICPTSRVTNSL